MTTARPNKWWMLGAVSAATFMLLLDVTVINVALPDIQADLNATFSDLQWVIDAYTLTLAAFLLTAGTLADQLGRRRLFLIGLLTFTVSSLGCGLATTPMTLNLARAIEGVGGAVMYAVTPAMIANDFHGRQRGLAFGISGGVTGLAVAVGPLLGGALTAIDWRWVFLLNVPVGIAVGIVTLTKVGESQDPRHRRIDWIGQILFCLALSMLVFALIRGEAQGWGSPLIVSLLIASPLLFALFVVAEHRQPTPMFDLRLFTNRSFNGLSAATLLNNAAINVAILFQILYMQLVLGFTAFQTGIRYLPLTVLVFLSAAVAGALSGRIPARLLVGAGSAVLGVGLLITSRLTVSSHWTAMLPGMVLAGLGMGLFNPARAFTAVALVPARQAGMSSGISETFQQGGVAVGIAALGSVANARIRGSFTHLVDGIGGFSTQQAQQLSHLVASGRLAEVAAAVPGEQRSAIFAASERAFIDGLNTVLLFGGCLALAAAVLGALLIRSSDMHRQDDAPTDHPPAPPGPAQTVIAPVNAVPPPQ